MLLQGSLHYKTFNLSFSELKCFDTYQTKYSHFYSTHLALENSSRKLFIWLTLMARYPGSPNPCLLAIPLNMLVKLLTSWAKVIVTLWSTSVGCGTAGEGGGLVPLSLSWSDTSRDFCAEVQHKLVETTNTYYKSRVGVVKLPLIICYPLLRGGGGIKYPRMFYPPPPP